MTLKKYLLGFCLTGFMLQPALSYAGADLFLLNLYRIERCTLMAGSENVASDQIDTCEALLYETMDQAEELNEKLSDEELAQMNELWESLQYTFEGAIEDPMLMQDFYTRDEVNMARQQVSELLAAHLEFAEGPMALAQQLEIIAREYLQRANAIFGGSVGTENVDIAELVAQADMQFEKLKQQNPDSFSLQSAQRRYAFIRSRLIDYNVDMIPFLVDTYTNQIVQSLLDLSDELNPAPAPAVEATS